MKCMNGQIISGTSICVDYWNWTPEKKYKRFLSHLHADHTYKLNSTFRENIYTSKFNAWLVKKWFNIDPDLIEVLDVGSSHLMYDEDKDVYFTVTLIDANHCPGSVMFLFQGSFGSILYTGDFRYSPSMLKNPMLKSLIENENLNRLYLDNTFAAEHCEFPPRHEALQEVLALIRSHPEHHILIGLRKLGKEEVLLEIALDLKEKILVSDEKLEILKYLQFKNVFTTDPTQSRILVRNMHQINSSYIHKLKEEKGPVLTILLTALYSVMPLGEKCWKMQEDKELGIHRVPYSDHSSHSELAEFVAKVKPDTIHPIVKVTVPNEQNSSDIRKDSLDFLPSNSAWRNSIIPQSILQLCKNPQGCSERKEEETSSCLINRAIVNKEMIPYQLTEDESRSSTSGRSQEGNEILSSNKIYTDCLEMLSDPTNMAELNELEMCDKFSEVTSEDWFSLSDEELTQKSVAGNSLAFPKPQSICEKAVFCNLTNEIDFERTPELRLPSKTQESNTGNCLAFPKPQSSCEKAVLCNLTNEIDFEKTPELRPSPKTQQSNTGHCLAFPKPQSSCEKAVLCNLTNEIDFEKTPELRPSPKTQQSNTGNCLAFPKPQRSCEKAVLCNLTNEIDFERTPEFIQHYNGCGMTDDDKVSQQPFIEQISNVVNFLTPDEELSQLQCISNTLVMQPAQHDSEYSSIVKTLYSPIMDTSVDLLEEEKLRCSTPNFLKNKSFCHQDFNAQSTPDQSLSKLPPIIEGEAEFNNDQNPVIGDCSGNEELSPYPDQQLSPDFIDLSMVPDSEYFVSECYSKTNVTDRTKEIVPTSTRTKNKSSKKPLFHSPLGREKTTLFRKRRPTPKPIHMLESEDEDEETINDSNYNNRFQFKNNLSAKKTEVNDIINNCCVKRKTKTNSTFKGNKKIRITEEFKHLLMNSQSDLRTDSFCEAIATDKNYYLERASLVGEDSTNETVMSSRFEIDENDVFYKNIEFAISSWKKSIRSQFPKRALKADLGTSDQSQLWGDYDWNSIFERTSSS